MAGQFAGKVVLVTGATGNLGSAVCDRFGREGAHLVLVDRNEERLAASAERLHEAFGTSTLKHVADLSDPAAVDGLFYAAVDAFGSVDIVAHTVGGYESGKTVMDADLDIWERMMNLNARPVYLVTGRAAKQMITQPNGGKIVVVLARSGLAGSARHSAYTASKAAAQRVVESLSLEVRDQNVNVNAVMPSTIDTHPNRQSMPNADFSKWVTPGDVASAIAWLASDDARALHGISLEVYNRA
jgi:NAD(P)-dependent dehydrogenase (short-subunit alcohol dehydrogenase family)